MPKTYARRIYLQTDADHIPPPANGNNREEEIEIVRHKNALVDMMRCYWNSDSLNMSEENMVKLFRTADGKPIEPVYRGGKKLTGMDAVAAQLRNSEEGGIQILSPEDGKPHRITTDISNMSISDNPVREPVAPRMPEPPQKPGRFVRFLHAIFHNQKKMNDYITKMRDYETKSIPEYEKKVQEYENKVRQRYAYEEENKAVLDTYKARKDKLPEVKQVPQGEQGRVNINIAKMVLHTPEADRKTLFAQRKEVRDIVANPDRIKLNNQEKTFAQLREENGAPQESNLQKLDKLAQKAMTDLQKAVDGDYRIDITKNIQRVAALRSVYASPEIAKNLESFNGRVEDWVEKQIPANKVEQVMTLSGGGKTAAKLCLDSEGTSTTKALCALGTKKEPAKPLFDSEKTKQKEVSRSSPVMARALPGQN